MTDRIGSNYRKSPEAIANYDYIDIASGLGYVAFYGVVSETGGSDNEELKRELITFQDLGYWKGGGANEGVDESLAAQRIFTSSAFNLPRTIRGDIVFTDGVKGAGSEVAETITVEVYRVDADNNETLLSRKASGQLPANNVANVRILFDDVQETVIKRGEKIRLKISGAQAGQDYGISPTDQDGDDIIPSANPPLTSVLKLNVPFKIDL